MKNPKRKLPVASDEPAVEFDPAHKDSPLCACKWCNEEWLARRNQPISKKHEVKKQAVDSSKQPEYAKLFAAHGIYVSITGHVRSPQWHLMNTAKTWSLTAAFDIDLDRVLKQLNDGKTLAQVDVTFRSTQPVVASTAKGATLTGGPWCAMCGEPGGLPSPNMVQGALLLKLKLHFEPTDARLAANRLHPGRCRKRLRQLLDAAKAQKATNK